MCIVRMYFYVCVCDRGIFSYALLSATSVISSENRSDEAGTAFQGCSFGLQNSGSLLFLSSHNKVVFNFILFRLKCLYIFNLMFILDI